MSLFLNRLTAVATKLGFFRYFISALMAVHCSNLFIIHGDKFFTPKIIYKTVR